MGLGDGVTYASRSVLAVVSLLFLAAPHVRAGVPSGVQLRPENGSPPETGLPSASALGGREFLASLDPVVGVDDPIATRAAAVESREAGTVPQESEPKKGESESPPSDDAQDDPSQDDPSQDKPVDPQGADPQGDVETGDDRVRVNVEDVEEARVDLPEIDARSLPPKTRSAPDPATAQVFRGTIEIDLREWIEPEAGGIVAAEPRVVQEYIAEYFRRAGYRVRVPTAGRTEEASAGPGAASSKPEDPSNRADSSKESDGAKRPSPSKPSPSQGSSDSGTSVLPPNASDGVEQPIAEARASEALASEASTTAGSDEKSSKCDFRIVGEVRAVFETPLVFRDQIIAWKYFGTVDARVFDIDGKEIERIDVPAISREGAKSEETAALDLRRFLAKVLYERIFRESRIFADREVVALIETFATDPLDLPEIVTAEEIVARLADLGVRAVPYLLEAMTDQRNVLLDSTYPGLEDPQQLRVYHLADKALEEIFQKVSRMHLRVNSRERFIITLGWENEWRRFCPSFRESPQYLKRLEMRRAQEERARKEAAENDGSKAESDASSKRAGVGPQQQGAAQPQGAGRGASAGPRG
jgi:hypothetical protein